MNQYAGRLAGLGVATIVFSVLVFISGVALAIMLGSGTILLSSDANSMSEIANAVNKEIDNDELSSSKEAIESGLVDQNGNFTQEGAALVTLGIGAVGTAGGVVIAISGVLTLIAGIIALRRANYPKLYHTVFVWAIIGAIASILVARLVSLILCICIAISAKKGDTLLKSTSPDVPPAAEPNALEPLVPPKPAQ